MADDWNSDEDGVDEEKSYTSDTILHDELVDEGLGMGDVLDMDILEFNKAMAAEAFNEGDQNNLNRERENHEIITQEQLSDPNG